ncbi:MAG TPA: tetratricopeptide repeat protein [Pseudomonadales bacterium]|nr:tetratricopeptide repeat protein [Pseudomonadales bacterium]
MQHLYTAMSDNERQNAIDTLQKRVDGGDAEAAFRLGRYFHLESKEKNLPRAVSFYTLAMKQGHAWATNNLGLMYKTGEAGQTDLTKAIDYFAIAAGQGDPHAYRNLGELYVTGHTAIPLSVTMRVEWSKQLAYQYRCNCTVPADQEKYFQYLKKAAALGDPESLSDLGSAYSAGEGVPVNKELAHQYWQQAADKGYTFADVLLGSAHANGDGFPIDKALAVQFWMKGLEGGECSAMVRLGDAYDNSWGVPVDKTLATQYYEKAVQCNRSNNSLDGFNLWKLATRYRNAIGVTQDCEKALKLLEESISTNDFERAYPDLGYLYQNGCGTIAADPQKAFTIYLHGAKNGVALSQNNVGAMLKHGIETTPPDRVRAYAWLLLAMQNGAEIAKRNLNDFSTMFSDADRAAGQAHMQKIQYMITHMTPEQLADDTLY